MADLTTKEVAAQLGVSTAKARQIIEMKLVKSYSLGPRSTRVPQSELDRLRRGQ